MNQKDEPRDEKLNIKRERERDGESKREAK